ncbi:hypothetical protein BJ875DRAFT_434820 [Amylocarpus encephaloides]|uniref:Glycoside hydrolase 131 catalytic N-terminal domain-containing protein n=1 Tax=Amylocarpus encephaloides TaxID=45428 RepID=A0A9P7Y7U4_9HELO|nr:hypothetical protein BJ875DRAFT_434820 [Amylocarpus encephaloides]
MTLIKNTFSALVWTSSALAQKCPVALEGRIPAGSTPATFDITASPFDSKNVKGQNLTFAEIIQLPTNLSASLFDTNNTIPLLLTLSGQSIFAPSADNIQTGFRRCELLPATNNGTDASTLGQKIIHFSVMKDDTKPLNTTHGYQMVFLESADFSTNQIVVKTGTISGLEGKVAQGETLVVEGNINTDAGVIFEAAFSGGGVWHNFGLVMDFDANTTQVLYSQNSVSLAAVTQPVANDISGQGQYHFGLLKKPSGDNITDVTKEGFQPSGINEGVFYGGLFVEEGAGGCLSLSA